MSDAPAVPTHLGIILDGNRRWARANNLSTLDGHRKGAEVLKEVALGTFERGIKYLSVYVFSVENWQRTEEEVGYLMNLAVRAVEKYLDEFHKAGIKLVMLGRRERLDKIVLKSIEVAEAKTAGNTSGTLGLCFNYGGHEELVDAVNQTLNNNQSIDTSTLRKNLYHPEIPDLDLIIRTSGEQRLSGFMLYRASYAELSFINKLWPDFTLADLDAVLSQYLKRERRYGK